MSMSLTRAFTARRSKNSNVDGGGGGGIGGGIASRFSIGGAGSREHNRESQLGSIRNKISAPVHLIHTTNMLSYNAPDIRRTADAADAAGSCRWSDDGSASSASSAASSSSSTPTSPDVASRDETCPSPDLDRLSGSSVSLSAMAAEAEPPEIPARAPYHTKKASYEAIARSRSASQLAPDRDTISTISTKASVDFSRYSSTSTNTSISSRAPSESLSLRQQQPAEPWARKAGAPAPASASQRQQQKQQPSLALAPPRVSPITDLSHPFGPELAQVTEIAEEYGVKERVELINEEERELVSKGLLRFAADIYIADVDALFPRFFSAGVGVGVGIGVGPLRHAVAPTVWI